MRTTFLCVVCCALVACSASRDVDFSGYDGADVAVLVGEVSACVPRRHFTPWHAKQWSSLTNPDGSSRPVTAQRLELSAFWPSLDGYTDREFQAYAESRYDRSKSPPSWVRIELLDMAVAQTRGEIANSDRRNFTVNVGVDERGFTVRRRDPGCIGQRAAAGATIAIEVGAECLNDELRTGRFGERVIEFYCAVSRCFAWIPESVAGFNYVFDFAASELAQWARLDERVRQKVRGGRLPAKGWL